MDKLSRHFAHLLKMNRISLSNISRKGDVPSHLAVIAALTGAMADGDTDFLTVLACIEITPKKPCGAGIGGRFCGKQQNGLDLFNNGDGNG